MVWWYARTISAGVGAGRGGSLGRGSRGTLGSDQIRGIADIQLDLLRRRLAERELGLEVTDRAVEQLARAGFDPVFGARPLKRAIQHQIENPLAQLILAGKFVAGDTVLVEERGTLIDYPRGVGLDDESLRTFQSIGVVDRVLPHTVPNQILRFFDANRKLLVEMAPPDARFGWPKRNGFVQPMVDAELLVGLDRFEQVNIRWDTQMTSCAEDSEGVTVDLSDGTAVRARWGR